jgi:hypothetical protein
VTTPAPPRQQARQQPPPPPAAAPVIPPQTLAAMALPLAALLLTPAAVSAQIVVAALRLRFRVAAALFWLAMLWVLSRIIMPNPPPVTGVIGAASERVSRLNTARRAQFAIASSVRVMNAMLAARAHGEDVIRAGQEQVERERRFFQQHLDAMWNRTTAAGKVDMAALEHGPLLGWLAHKDDRTTPECRKASGMNFYAWAMPAIGFPGTVHAACRCTAVAPWPHGKLLPSRGARYARAA